MIAVREKVRAAWELVRELVGEKEAPVKIGKQYRYPCRAITLLYIRSVSANKRF